MTMSLSSIHIALPEEVVHGNKTVRTGIFKKRINGPVGVRQLNLDGDGQADLVNHGGMYKAVYAYALDHYAWWRRTLDRDDLEPGHFGENLSIRGLDEAELCVGDRLRIGTAEFCISQPRVPCFKLGIRFGDPAMPKKFAASLRTGVYLQVIRQGSIEAGDEVERFAHGHGKLSIRHLFDAYLKPNDAEALKTLALALDVPELSDEWLGQIEQRLSRRGHKPAPQTSH